ncbi:MAG TPA: HAMP domain-containing sensor histidine kinase [Polyangiaceae bacterium]|nr:HAMP domain-containing sensor histidine kinase [Polyangiaceae bacterium]
MTRRRSIQQSLRHTYLLSIATIGASLVGLGALSATYVALLRDDANSRALAQLLGGELREHAQDSLSVQREALRRELEEQRWFERETEVWRERVLIAGTRPEAELARWTTLLGCTTARLHGAWHRICGARPDPSVAVVVASPVGPVFRAQLPVVAAISIATALAVLGFSLLSRLLVHRSLDPLARFESAMARLPAKPGQRLQSEWGAREINHLAQTSNALLARLDEIVEREQAFAANAAHELRSPLTRLRGQLELLLDEPHARATNPSAAELRNRLERAAKTCTELVNCTEALLALARREASLHEAVNWEEVALSICDNLSDQERARVSVNAQEALVRGDLALLGLAAQNLVDNALKYSAGPIELNVLAAEKRCSFVVVDCGPGISSSELDRVRQPFVRGSSNVRGTGLGLALVEHVAKLHGGELSLKNRSERSGLIAALSLPRWSPSRP